MKQPPRTLFFVNPKRVERGCACYVVDDLFGHSKSRDSFRRAVSLPLLVSSCCVGLGMLNSSSTSVFPLAFLRRCFLQRTSFLCVVVSPFVSGCVAF